MEPVTILLVGDDSYEMYVAAFYRGFRELGYGDAHLFATNRRMKAKTLAGGLALRAENKLAFGPRVRRLNKELMRRVDELRPELVFLYSARLVFPGTVRWMRERGITVFAYNNDDPFAAYYPWYFWRHFKRSLKYVDAGFVFRGKNLEDYRRCGCKRAEILRAYYIASRNYHMPDTPARVPKVVFLGHNEKDEREEYIRLLLDAGIEVGVTEQSWEDYEKGNPRLVRLKDSHKHYNEMLNAAQIALVFLSKINNDTYTQRCFEIPATKTLMIAPYTEEIAQMFQEDKEVVLFRDSAELLEKVRYYLAHEDERRIIAEAGYERVMRDGHEVCDRVRQVMDVYRSITKP